MMKIDVLVWDGIALTQQTINDELEDFYKVIGCNTFEAYSYTELGKLYGLDIYIDGNGKFEQDTITGIFVRDGKVIDFLAGKVMILRHDEEGNSVSVNPDDILKVSKHLGESAWLVFKQPDTKWKLNEGLLILNC